MNALKTSVPDATLPVQQARPVVVPLNPAKLTRRLEHWKIVPPTFAAVYDRIFIALLEDAPTKSAGGIDLPDQVKGKLSSQKGLIMKAGPRAIEQLYSHGMAIGDIVVCARFSPYERTYMAAGRMFSMLVVRSPEVLGCEDLQKAYDEGDLWMEMAPDGTVSICDRENGTRRRDDPADNIEGI